MTAKILKEIDKSFTFQFSSPQIKMNWLMLDSSMQLSCNKWISEVVGQPITPEKLKLLDGEFTVYQHYQDYNQIAKDLEGTSESVYDMTPEYFDSQDIKRNRQILQLSTFQPSN